MATTTEQRLALLREQAETQDAIDSIRRQIDSRQGQADAQWTHRATAAMQYKTRRLQVIDAELAALADDLDRRRLEAFARIARELLPKYEVRRILEAVDSCTPAPSPVNHLALVLAGGLPPQEDHNAHTSD